ncbi:TPA: hypothetical protein N0F65_009542 [Lagenidium giganteum]|uniref:Uncharacterized protein n=1 Tax=Lagenidium giganteum TaxID=4803 RepID=A0AAV2YVS4_9STRA|nr:TPA: hypothetical protein N0F65_009542 [Lagenidium giganteum]
MDGGRKRTCGKVMHKLSINSSYWACDGETLGRSIAFDMIDELVERITQLDAKTATQLPRSLWLRSDAEYTDMILHTILPRISLRPIRCTNQAVYYPATLLMPRPSFDLFAFKIAQPDYCRLTTHNYKHRTRTPSWTSLSCQVNRGGFSYMSCRGFDVSTVFRVRTCARNNESDMQSSPEMRETQQVIDFRSTSL